MGAVVGPAFIIALAFFSGHALAVVAREMQLDQLVEGGEEPKFSVLVRQLRRLHVEKHLLLQELQSLRAKLRSTNKPT